MSFFDWSNEYITRSAEGYHQQALGGLRPICMGSGGEKGERAKN